MKKFLSILFCASMILGTLSGCATKKDETPSGTSSATPEAKIDLSVKPELKLLMPYVPFDPKLDPTAIYLEEATGYKVQYDMLPNEDALTKLNTIIASKADYDIIVLTKNDFEATVGTGAYQPLNELLPTYAPELKAKTAEGLWTNVTIDNEIKGIPEAMASENYGLSYRVRMDLLKKAGIQTMPSTPDELYTAFKAVKDKLNIIPMTASYAVIPEIASAFGMYQKFNLVDNKIVYQAEVAGAKDYVTFMNKLFTDGLLDNEYAQNTGEVMREKFFTSKAAVYQLAWWNEPTALNTIKEKAPEAEVAYLPALKDANGKSGLPIGRGIERVMVVPKASKNKEHALNYMNIKVDEEIFRKTVMGEENVHYKKLAEDSYEPILPKFFDDKNNGHYFLTGADTAAYSLYWSQTRAKKDPILYQEFNLIQENANKATLHYDPMTYMQPNKAYSETIVKVNKFTEDAFKQFITGTKPLSEWDSFIAELNATGLTEINKIVGDWWTAEGAAIANSMTKN
ncbi:MAG: extracellular solute-binding protein [Oscillospiraceae bacterium]